MTVKEFCELHKDDVVQVFGKPRYRRGAVQQTLYFSDEDNFRCVEHFEVVRFRKVNGGCAGLRSMRGLIEPTYVVDEIR